jgi:uracil-DNA glycosylase family 4
MFIGEAPSRSDTVTKKTLSGSAGKVFDQLVKDVGLKKADWCVTTIIVCIPLTPEPQRYRTPTKEEALNCGERLDELIELFSPQKYIAVGKFAKKYLPKGLEFHFEIDDPHSIMVQGGVGSNPYKRSVFYLKRFLEGEGYYGSETKKETD